MGVSARAVCITESKDVFKISRAIQKEITNLISKNRPKELKPHQDKENIFHDITLSASSQMLFFDFNLKGEKRQLHVHFDCDCDCTDLGDSKIICSLGAWGSSLEILEACAVALNSFGPVFVQPEDTVDDNFICMTELATT